MGCDIHIVVERRRKPAEPWVGLYTTDRSPGVNSGEIRNLRPPIARRDYDFFTEVANVRGRSNTAKYPQNVPEDISALAWQEYMSAPTDHHSASHMSADEFCAIHHRVRPEQSRADHATYDLLNLWSDEPDGVEYRVVFWFDN